MANARFTADAWLDHYVTKWIVVRFVGES